MFAGSLINVYRSMDELIHPPKPPSPRIEQLLQGDILIKMNDNTGINRAISIGQMLTNTGGHMLWTHAGLATSSTMIAEMNGEGLQHHNLTGENAGYIYAVFRCRYQQIAAGACRANAQLVTKNKKVVYNTSGATGSLMPSFLNTETDLMQNALKQMDSGETYSLFCSEHVVFCYQVALEENSKFGLGSEIPKIPNLRMQEVFSRRAWEYSPAYLYAQLMESKIFDYQGRWKGMKWIA